MRDARGSVLVTGATGALGPRVVTALHEAGYHIRTLSLDAPLPGMLPDDVEVQIGDITDAQMVQAAMDGCDAVIHMAALLHIVNPPPELRTKYEQINVGGTANVVDAAMQAGVRRLVFFSTIAVYGDSGGQIVTEETPPCPQTFYAQTKLDAEKIVLAAHRANGQPLSVVLRLGAVYGSRIKGNYQKLVYALARRRFIPVGDGNNRRTLVYDKDIARAVVLAMQHSAAGGKTYNVTDGKFHPVNEIIEAICLGLGRTPPRFAIPKKPASLIAGWLEDGFGIAGLRSPIVRATIDKFTEDIAVDGSRFQKELGFTPQYDLRKGWLDTVDEMRSASKL